MSKLQSFRDSGFEGGVLIPTGAAREILAAPDMDQVQMADGRIVSTPRWDGSIELLGKRFPCEVVSLGNRFLLGQEVIDQLEVCFLFGKEVRIRFD
jgi:hypothetical protein